MDIKEAVQAVINGQDLAADQMHSVMMSIMSGEVTPAQIGGFLVGLRVKGETIDEIAAAAKVMRELATHVEVDVDNLVDTCGTGGDAQGTFNISTAGAFVAAAAGAHVAKHGNRSVSSQSGSADVLEQAGVRLDLSPRQVADCIRKTGLGFMFAPAHHGAMKYAIGPRRDLAVRTIFNVLGPLTNPAGAPNQVIGVFDKDLTEPMARVLARLGSRHVMVVHSDDGMDEIGITAGTHVAELKDGEVESYVLHPKQFSMDTAGIESIKVRNPAESLALITATFDNQAGPARDIITLNAGAAIYVSGLADSLEGGVAKADEAIASGAAKAKVAQFVAATLEQKQ